MKKSQLIKIIREVVKEQPDAYEPPQNGNPVGEFDFAIGEISDALYYIEWSLTDPKEIVKIKREANVLIDRLEKTLKVVKSFKSWEHNEKKPVN